MCLGGMNIRCDANGVRCFGIHFIYGKDGLRTQVVGCRFRHSCVMFFEYCALVKKKGGKHGFKPCRADERSAAKCNY